MIYYTAITASSGISGTIQDLDPSAGDQEAEVSKESALLTK